MENGPQVGGYDKRAILKTTLPTTPELEKIAKILKKYIKNLHASKYPKFKLEHLF